MTKIKHTIKSRAIAIFVKAHIIVGNALVASVSQPHVSIQFQIIGKFVLSFIHLHSHAALTFDQINHQKPNNTAKNHPNKYDNILYHS